MKKALLKVDDLSVKFKTMEGMQTAVQGVSLEVMEGEVFCIVGESGCGKSLTSLSIMGLVEKPGVVSAGAILLDGQDISRMKEDKLRELRGNKMSMIFQEPLTSLNPLFTVGNQMDEVFRLHQKAGRYSHYARFERGGRDGRPCGRDVCGRNCRAGKCI